MKSGTKKAQSVSRVSAGDARMLVVWTMVDTSMRLFVPVLGLTLVGYLCDQWLRTEPMLVFSGMALGIVLAIALVTQQYRRVTKKEGKK